MDELFGNLIYFIPIAIVIFRVISGAREQSKKNQPPKKPSGELSGKIPEARKNLYEKAAAGQIIRPAAQQAGPARPQVPVWSDTQKKPAAKKPVPAVKPQQPHKETYKPLFPEAFPEGGDFGATGAGQFAPAAGSLPEHAAGIVPGGLPVHAGLTPLQQAFVWSEFLGAPKSERGV
jgi:hypothetical protein